MLPSQDQGTQRSLQVVGYSSLAQTSWKIRLPDPPLLADVFLSTLTDLSCSVIVGLLARLVSRTMFSVNTTGVEGSAVSFDRI